MRFAVVFLFIFVAVAVEGTYAKKHQAKHETTEHEEAEEIEDVEWPQPDAVRNFEVPKAFTHHEGKAEKVTPPSTDRHHHQKSGEKKRTTHHYY